MTMIDPGRPGTRETIHHGPDHLVLSEHPVFRRFWHAVCFSEEVAGEPLARAVLGQDLVVWRPDPEGPVSVAHDRCAHRDAPLSMGG